MSCDHCGREAGNRITPCNGCGDTFCSRCLEPELHGCDFSGYDDDYEGEDDDDYPFDDFDDDEDEDF
jgi:hypothetical protein